MRQTNRFTGVMDNFNRVQEIQAELMGAEGTMDVSYAEYLNSVEASANRTQAALESLWIESINSDAIKFVYDFLTGFIKLVEAIGLVNVAMTGLGYVFLSTNETFEGFNDNLSRNLSEKLIENMSNKITELGVAQEMIAAKSQLAGGASAQLGNEMVGTTVKTNVMSGAMSVLSKEIGGATVAQHLFSFGLTLGVSMAITVAVRAVTALVSSYQEYKRELDEIVDLTKANISGHRDNIKSLSDLTVEYNKLNGKLGENRDFTRLNTEEQERYFTITEQMSNIAPEVISWYTDKGEAVTDYTLKIEDLIEKEEQLIEMEKGKLWAKEKELSSKSEKEMEKQENRLNQIEERIKSSSKNLEVARRNLESQRGTASEAELNKLQGAVDKYRAELSGINAERQVVAGLMQSEIIDQKQRLELYFDEMDAIEGVTEGMKNLARSKAHEVLDEEGYEAAKQSIVTFTEAYEKMMLLLSGDIVNLSADNIEKVANMLEKLGISAEWAEMMIYGLLDVLGLASSKFGELADTIGIGSEQFKDLAEEIDGLNDAYAKLSSGQSLDRDELFGLIETYDELMDYIVETGDLTLKNGEMVREVSESRRIELVREIENEQRKQEELHIGAQKELKQQEEKLEMMAKVFGTESKFYTDAKRNLNELIKHEKELGAEIQANEGKKRALQQIYDSDFNAADIGAAQQSFSEASSEIEYYQKLMDELAEYGKLSGETHRDIVENHHELMPLLWAEGDQKLFLMELIEESKERQIDSYHEQLLASKHYTEQAYAMHGDMFNALFAMYDLDKENFANLQHAKAIMIQQSMNLLNQQTQASIRALGSTKAQAVATRNALMDKRSGLDTGIQSVVSIKKDAPSSENLVQQGINRAIADNIGNEINKINSVIESFGVMDNFTPETVNIPNFASSGRSSKKVGGGGGRSGGSSSSREHTHVEYVEMITDRYHKYNVALEDVNTSLARNEALLNISTDKDRITLLEKEIKLLSEKQQVISLTTNELRKERKELLTDIQPLINLDDGAMGIDSFDSYTKQVESGINAMIDTLNATKNEDARGKLEDSIADSQNAYDKLADQFARYMEIEMIIPENQTEWWNIEFDKFNQSLEAIDVNFEKYEKRIEHINTMLSLKIRHGEDSLEVLEEEYDVLSEINEIYAESLEDIATRMEVVNEGIENHEARLRSLGDVRNAAYEDSAKRLIMLRAEEDKLFEHQKANITALVTHEQNRVDKYIEKINLAKDKTLEAFAEMRESLDEFNLDGFERSIDDIVFKLNVIDGIFRESAEFNLSTGDARASISEWVNEVNGAYSSIQGLQGRVNDVLAIEANTEDEINAKKEQLIGLIEEQIGKELELRDIGEDLGEQIANMASEHREIEAALNERIRLRQKELKELREQHRQEDRIRSMLEKQLELMRAFDDTRYSYITGQGDEIFTHDQNRVNEIQREITEMQRAQEREDAVDAMNEDIAQMQEDLNTTRQINAEQLNILRQANEGIQGLLGMLDDEIARGEEELEGLYEQIGQTFADSITEALAPLIDRFEAWADGFLDRILIDTTEDSRRVSQGNLGATQSHTLQEGQYLSHLANMYRTTVDRLMELNPQITDRNVVSPGQQIKVPSYDTGGLTSNVPREGAPAILHNKELVLNEQDTKNILNSVNLAREFSSVLSKFSKPQQVNRETNEGNNSVVLNNPVFNGVKDVGDFSNKLNDLYRRGFPQMG